MQMCADLINSLIDTIISLRLFKLGDSLVIHAVWSCCAFASYPTGSQVTGLAALVGSLAAMESGSHRGLIGRSR